MTTQQKQDLTTALLKYGGALVAATLAFGALRAATQRNGDGVTRNERAIETHRVQHRADMEAMNEQQRVLVDSIHKIQTDVAVIRASVAPVQP